MARTWLMGSGDSMDKNLGLRLGWDDLREEVLALRREIHRWPEPGHAEYATVAKLSDFLTRYSVKVKKVTNTGLLAFTDAGKKQTVALRVDLDALSVEEKTGVDFTSCNPGFMHACGHDAHACIGAAVAVMCQQMADRLPVNVKVIFQPAEEASPQGGAKAMIGEGVLKNPDVDAVLGFHSWPDYPVGEVGVRPGPMMAASDRIMVDLWGSGTHAAQPHRGVDSILMASTLIQAMYRDIPREIDPFAWYVLSIGRFEAGTRYNVICDHAFAEGTLRTFNKELRETLHKKLCELAEHIGSQYGGKAQMSIVRGYDAVNNDHGLTERFVTHARTVLGAAAVHTEGLPSLIAEDFSAYGQECPSIYFHLGCGGDNPLHSDRFLVAEEAIDVGVNLIQSFLLNYQQ